MSAAEVPAIPPVRAPEALLEIEWFAAFNRLPPDTDIRLHIIRVNELRPTPVLHRVEGKAGEFYPLAVEVINITVRSGGEDLLRHRLRHKTEPFTLILHGAQRVLPIGKRSLEIVLAGLDPGQHLVEPVH